MDTPLDVVVSNTELMRKVGKSNVRKGKNGERRIARLLTEWTGEEFRRRRVEGRESNVVDRESTADIIPAKKRIIFSIEVKCGECISFDGILANPKNNKWTVWWHQCCYDAMILSEAFSKKIWPMMFFKPHPNFDWVAVAKDAFDYGILEFSDFPKLSLDMFGWLGPVEHNVSQSKKNKVLKSIQLHTCYLARWKDFADNVKAGSIFY